METTAPTHSKKRPRLIWTYLAIIILFLALGGLLYLARDQEQQIFRLNQAYQQQLDQTAVSVTNLAKQIATLKSNLEDTEKDLSYEQNRNQEFENQINKLAGTVGTLDKLSKTDEELLQKYSKVYFLNENYIPSRLRQIDAKYVITGKGDQYFHAEALDFLDRMIDAAKKDGVDLKIISAYRSFETQSVLKGDFTQIYGSGANTFSADQGYSEHQLGTTVDLTDTATGATNTSFKDTKAYDWLVTNAYRYGFILSYPENNNFYVYEPWHWRFVGTDLARDLHRANANFYDWDQRKINEYLVDIFD